MFSDTQAQPQATPTVHSTSTPVTSPARAASVTRFVIQTSEGDIPIEFFSDRAPKTVENFIGLSQGTKEWTDPVSHKKVQSKSLYAGTIFHRVIPGFMIQGGDPEGSGRGGPGYRFEDETSKSDSFDKPGLLAMANAGPNTNGSQFFITLAAVPWLNGKHTIFGQTNKEGLAVAEKIAKLPRNAADRPEKTVTIKSIQALKTGS